MVLQGWLYEGTTRFHWRDLSPPSSTQDSLVRTFSTFSRPEGSECKCALVPSGGQPGKVPLLRTPLGQGSPTSGCRDVSQLILSRSTPEMHFPDSIESCKQKNRSIIGEPSPTGRVGWI